MKSGYKSTNQGKGKGKEGKDVREEGGEMGSFKNISLSP